MKAGSRRGPRPGQLAIVLIALALAGALVGYYVAAEWLFGPPPPGRLAAPVAIPTSPLPPAPGQTLEGEFVPVDLAVAPVYLEPPPAPQVPRSQLAPVIEHEVRAGESLSLIAGLYGVTVEAIAEANDILDVSLIAVGQILTIPG